MNKLNSFFLFVLAFFTFLYFGISQAEAATLYYNAATNTNWSTLTNWWTDAGFTSQAVILPGVSDDVIISGNVVSNSGATPSVDTMTVNGSSSFEIPITVANGATFNDSSTNTNASATFDALGQTGRLWFGVTVAPNGNVYAAVYGGDIYMQTAGVGNFVSLSQTTRNWRGIAAAPNGNIYAVVLAGDIYMQTNGTGDFIALGQTTRNWRNPAVAPNGNVYAADSNGDIYMQTNGTGNFIALGQTSRNWRGMGAAPNGDIYAVVLGGDIYMQTNGAGNFIALGQTSRNWAAVAAAPNGNVYAADSAFAGNNIYMQTAGTGDFVALGSVLVHGWGAISADPNGNVYLADFGAGDIYKQTNAQITGDATFNDTSTNSGTVTGDACFGEDATSSGVVLGDETTCTAAPTLTTEEADNLSKSESNLNANISNTGGADVTERGFYYGLTDSYGTTVSDTGTFSTGDFTESLTNLDCNTTYHYQAFATNSVGTTEGDDVTFTTNACSSTSSGGGGYIRIPSSIPTVTVPASIIIPPLIPTCTLTLTLKQGSRGDQVTCLQIKLTNLITDGLFGLKTKAAVILYQKAHSLVPDGVVGPITRASLK